MSNRTRVVGISIAAGLMAASGAYFFSTNDVDGLSTSDVGEPRKTVAPSLSIALPQTALENAQPDSKSVVTVADVELQVDSAGHLVVNAATRGAIEQLSDVESIAELYEVKEHLHQTLPPTAVGPAADLIERYYNYRRAVREDPTASKEAGLPQDAAIALDRLHALRVEYFGAELTDEWFAAEDAIGRQMIANALRDQ